MRSLLLFTIDHTRKKKNRLSAVAVMDSAPACCKYLCLLFAALALPSATLAGPTRLDSRGSLDSLGGGHVLRQLDPLGGGHVLRALGCNSIDILSVPEYLSHKSCLEF